MSKLEMAPEEIAALVAFIERYLPDLRVEIANTDQREFRKFLKQREELIREILQRLKQPVE
ncbi:MAG TPA: hypothetical protein PLR20_01570 [Syntrophales bacterium]|nr:hypothetical protein [Syntrophales bacterium]HOX94670.1 hypothetical protein [Syntrophales bacterium]HPI56866.1 hypothetical protein [Syntrophales bacterium]HPN23452.1 hypothetical protein [Syntrophales bacterium]HQM28023.1 hypothetical protein [Syntrophales bacterium]